MTGSFIDRLQAGDGEPLRGRKILVLGDIALDRSFICDAAPPGFHAVHAGEAIFDVRSGGDDYGTIGSAYNTCLFLWARDAERAQAQGKAIQVAAPAPLAAALEMEKGEELEWVIKDRNTFEIRRIQATRRNSKRANE